MDKTLPLQGVQAVVIGIEDAYGWAIVNALQEAGACVASFTKTLEAGFDLSGDGFSGYCDTSDPERVETVLAVVVARFANLQVLVNLTPAPSDLSFEETSIEDFDCILQQNLTFMMRSCRAVIPSMQRLGKGSIVNVLHPFARRPAPHRVAYAAAHGGVIALSNAIMMDSFKDHVRINSILVDQPLLHAKGLGQAVVYLASDQSSYITGTTLSLDEYTSNQDSLS